MSWLLWPQFECVVPKIWGIYGTSLYTRYPIVARALGLGRVRRASKGILHTRYEYACK